MGLELWIIIILALAVIALVYSVYTLPSRDIKKQEADLIARIALLSSESEKKDLMIEDHKNRNRVLSERVEVLEGRVRDLELILYGKSMRGQLDLSVLNPPLLLIAVDPYFQRQDEIALNKAKIPYRRIVNATKEKVEAELRKARQNKSMYKYIIFSAHSDSNGVVMSDSTYLDAYWMNQNLVGAEIVVLAGCKTNDMADALEHIVSVVISMSENIPTQASQGFSEAFWSSMIKDDNPEIAFTEALNVEPTVKPYAELRRS